MSRPTKAKLPWLIQLKVQLGIPLTRDEFIRGGIILIRKHQPTGVRLTREDGDVIPVKVRFDGFDVERGTGHRVYLWTAQVPRNSGLMHAVEVSYLPDHCGLRFSANTVPMPNSSLVIDEHSARWERQS